MKKVRRKFSAEQKMVILRRHLLDGVAVSDVCDEYGINPNLFYRWQKTLFENGGAAFERQSGGRERKLEERVDYLKSRITHKDEVIAEIMESHVALKKSLGED